jgi:two-component sensor histidine kinase
MLQKTPVADSGVSLHHDLSTVIAAIPANARQRKITSYAFILIVVIAIVNAPFAHIQLSHDYYFFPIIQTAMCITNLLTAIFLFAQYSIYPQRALLALAGGFTISGLFVLLYTVAFPAADGATTLIGDKLNTPTWLSACCQTTFLLAVIVYALSKDRGEAANQTNRSTAIDIAVTIACVVIVTVALTWVATAKVGYLPTLHRDVIHRTPLARDVSAFLAFLNVAAFAVLFVHRRTVLDHWLMVTVVAWLPRVVMASVFNDIRFSEGWYLSRVFALFAGSSLLAFLLIETLLLHKRYDQYQRHLIAELDHRVKNILAQVAVVATSTRRGSRSIDEFLGSLDGRIQSMATAHTLLSESGWQSVCLGSLVHNELAPYAAGSNVTIGGTDVLLNSSETQALARVLHELATNAGKYGALSAPSGQVSVNWGLKPNGVATNLTLFWRELGGPPVVYNHPSSYGTNLIRNLIPHELGGTVDLAFTKEGVTCRIDIPIKRI